MELYYNFDISESIHMKNKLTLRNAPYLISLIEIARIIDHFLK